MEVETARCDARAQRPAVACLPGIRTCLECRCLWQVELPFVLEPVGEPRRLNPVLEIERGWGSEVDVAKLRAARARPTTVIPRTNNQVVQVLRVVLLEQLVDTNRPVKVFLIPPASDVQRRYGDPIHIWRHCLTLPECIEAR